MIELVRLINYNHVVQGSKLQAVKGSFCASDSKIVINAVTHESFPILTSAQL